MSVLTGGMGIGVPGATINQVISSVDIELEEEIGIDLEEEIVIVLLTPQIDLCEKG